MDMFNLLRYVSKFGNFRVDSDGIFFFWSLYPCMCILWSALVPSFFIYQLQNTQLYLVHYFCGNQETQHVGSV